MEPKAKLYIPEVFRSFQGFQIKDIKEWRKKYEMKLILESEPERQHFCNRCGTEQGPQKKNANSSPLSANDGLDKGACTTTVNDVMSLKDQFIAKLNGLSNPKACDLTTSKPGGITDEILEIYNDLDTEMIRAWRQCRPFRYEYAPDPSICNNLKTNRLRQNCKDITDLSAQLWQNMNTCRMLSTESGGGLDVTPTKMMYCLKKNIKSLLKCSKVSPTPPIPVPTNM